MVAVTAAVFAGAGGRAGAAGRFQAAQLGLPSGSCAPADTPASLRSNIHFQEQQWEYSLRTYPVCRVPRDAVERASAQLRSVPSSNQLSGTHVAAARAGVSAAVLPDGLGETPWTSIGPTGIADYWTHVSSGRVSALAVDPTNPKVIFLGAAGGGVWESIDGGLTWAPKTSNQPSESIGALAIDPRNHNTIYAGTGEGDIPGDAVYGVGILKSLDGGHTWTTLGNALFARQFISKIVVDPVTPNKVWAMSTAGLWVSMDGGTTWHATSLSGPFWHGYDVAVDLANHNIVYATVGNALFGSQGQNGIYKSVDGGATWSLLPAGPNGNSSTPGGSGGANAHVGRIQLALASTTGGVILYASVEDPSTSPGWTGKLWNVYSSTNGGSTWRVLSNPDPPTGPRAGSQYWYDDPLGVDPNDRSGKTLWLGGFDWFKTTDGGVHWTNTTHVYYNTPPNPVNPQRIHTDQHALAFAGSTMIVGNDGGIWTTPDAGTHWFERNDTLNVTQFYSAASDPAYAPTVVGGTQDNGTALWAGNASSLRWNQIFGGDGGDSAIDFTAPRTIYEEYVNLDLHKSVDGGNTWTSITKGIMDRSSSCFIAPFVMDSTNAHRLIAGTREVYETTDGGASWRRSSPDLTSQSGCINALAIAPSSPATIYAGTNTGKVWVTTNDGKTWNDISAGLNAPHSSISSIAVDARDPRIAYVTAGNFWAGGSVWRTATAGASWQNISANLPAYPANSVVVDPLDSAHLYLGTDQGVFESMNTGASWTLLTAGLPTVAVWQLTLNRNGTILLAATHGRGVFELFRSWLRLSAPSIKIGAPLALRGYGFQSGERLLVSLNGRALPLPKTPTADANGDAAVVIAVPVVPKGDYTVELLGATSHRSAMQNFSIR